jgi:ornithine carbamoyltransferase
MKRDLLTILDLSADEIRRLIDRARAMKAEWAAGSLTGSLTASLTGKVLGMIFVKPSTRTRVSFEVAMVRLGGHSIYLTPGDTQISRNEPLSDVGRVLSRYVDGIMVRTYSQRDIEELARFSTIPVINGLTDRYHPCQVLSDGLHVAWVGDGNNVAHSWINASARLGFTVSLACPPGYQPDLRVIERAQSQGIARVKLVGDPREAVRSADVVYTDVWASMGQESESEARKTIFRPYQVNAELMSHAPAHAIVMHCLPAHRGEEITDEVLEGPRSVIFNQAENRLHLQMALLEWLMTGQA